MGGLKSSLKIMKNIIQDNLRYMLSLGILIASLSMSVVSAEWEKVESQGVTYTTTNSLNKFYQFKSQEEQEGYLVFSNRRINMKLPLDGKVAYFNGVKVFLDRSLLLVDNKHLVIRVKLRHTRTTLEILHQGSTSLVSPFGSASYQLPYLA